MLACWVCSGLGGTSFADGVEEDLVLNTEPVSERRAHMAWCKEACFGMFVHWGLYSSAEGEWGGIKPFRAALRQSGVWYLSAVTNTSDGALTIEDVGSSSHEWAVLDTTPVTSIMSVKGVPQQSVDFTNVDAIGWFMSDVQAAKIVSLTLSALGDYSGYEQ